MIVARPVPVITTSTELGARGGGKPAPGREPSGCTLRSVYGNRARWVSLLGFLSACGGARVGPAPVPAPVSGVVDPAANVVECAGEEGEPMDLDAIEACSSDAQFVSAASFVLTATRSDSDVTRYLALFAGGGTVVRGRREGAEAYDATQDLAHLEVMLRARAAERQDEEGSFEVSFERVRVELAGERARVWALVVFAAGSGEDVVLEGQDVSLVRSGSTWRIARLRTWPRGWAVEDEGETFDDAYWAVRDRAVSAAQAALAAAPAAESVAARRRLAAALLAARRFREALAIARQLTTLPGATMTDWRQRAASAWEEGEAEEAREARERVASAALPDLGEPMSDELACGGEHRYAAVRARRDEADDATDHDGGESDVEPEEPCDFEVVARVDAGEASAGLRAVAVVRMTQGDDESQSHRLLLGGDRGWQPGPAISDGPFLGNQVTGTFSFDVSAVELRQLEPGGDEELLLRYDTVYVHAEDDRLDAAAGTGRIHERGFLVCARLMDVARCARVPEWISHEGPSGPARVATARVSFEPDGSIRTTRVRGHDTRLITARRTLREVMDAASEAERDGED